MSLTSYIRRLAGQTCHNLTEQFTPTFGVPVTQNFGDVASEGTSDDLARSDHVHGMPDQGQFIDDLASTASIFNELVLTATTNDVKTLGTIVLGGRDDIGDLGGYGTTDNTTAAAIASTASTYLQNASGGAAGNITSQVHPFKRTKQFLCRVRPVLNNITQLPSMFFATGMIRTSSTTDARTITDGVYFTVTTDAAGAGNYFAACTQGSVTTSVDTNVAPRVDGSNNVLFDTFRFTFDGTTVLFYINGTQVASITTNIPTSANKLAGLGAWMTNVTAVARTMVVDVIAWTGHRSYSE